MTEPKSTANRLPADPGETPEDVATLYSWANLHGAKYRDFSSSRAEAREEARLRVEEAKAIEKRRQDEEAERKAQEEAQIAARLAAEAAEAARKAEAERLAGIARQADAERQAVLAAQEAQRLAALQRSWQPIVQPGHQTNSPVLPDLQVMPDSYSHDKPWQQLSTPSPSQPAFASGIDSQFPQSSTLLGPDVARSSNSFGLDSRLPPTQEPVSNVPQDAWSSNPLVNPSAWHGIANPAPSEPYAPFLRYSTEEPSATDLGLAQFASPSVRNEASSYFGLETNLSRDVGTQSATSAPLYVNPTSPSSPYQPESFRAPNYEAPPYDTTPYAIPLTSPSDKPRSYMSSAQGQFPKSPSLTSSQAGISGANSPAFQQSSVPYVPQLLDSYSPWQAPSSRDSSQDLFEQRESISRPAWLVPDLPASQSAPQPTKLPPASLQEQYSAGSVSAPAPGPSYSQLPAPQYPKPQFRSSPSGSYGPKISATQVAQVSSSPQVHAQNQASTQNQAQSPNQPPTQAPAVTGTFLDSRDRISQRWYALKSVFDPQAAVEQAPALPPARVPALAIFSLAGGVGKTSIVAALGRALSSCGEQVMLVDTASYGLLPFFFGARDQRPGMLRTFNPPGVAAEAPVQLLTLDPDGLPPDQHSQEQARQQGFEQGPNKDWLTDEIARYSRNSSRVLVDLPTASGATTRRILNLAPVVLVPVLPDMSSVVSVGAIESFFRHNATIAGASRQNQSTQPLMPYYVLNQFDYSLPLHLDVREILREQIGDRLLPFALRRNPAVSEALAEGMTVMDYAPTVAVAEDYATLAGWTRSIAAPANRGHIGVRWSER